ncbi:S41 family peptidase [Phocaeicola sp.]|uniref:S41 family peptidase n=1 Tax=Phocaeicola sp. TaxID=2773926 RepID=UPI003AB72126
MRKNPIYFILSLILTTAFFSSCGEDRSGEYYALIGSKTWIYETMQQNYLFYEDLPAEEDLDFFDKPADFLESVASDKDKKNGVTFSHVDSVKTTRVQSNYPTYGIEGTLVRGTDGDYYYTILYVQSESPASEAGLQRGDHICTVNGIKLSSSNYTEYIQAPTKTYTYRIARKGSNATPDTLEVAMPQPRIIEEPSVFLTRNLTTSNGKKVFYIMYNSFEVTEEADLIAKFAEGLATSPNDIVLDLRYNPGGYVSTALLLSTILAPSNAMGQNCFNLIYNDKLDKVESYAFDPALLQGISNASYDHLYILTTGNTASASEIVINCLRPYVGEKLLQVGENTFGKNVAQSLFTNASYPQLEFWLTTAYISNSQNYYDYYTDGLKPDYELSEDVEGYLGELGTEQDALMNAVLQHIENGTFPSTETPDTETPQEQPAASRWFGINRTPQVIHNSIADKPKCSKITNF